MLPCRYSNKSMHKRERCTVAIDLEDAYNRVQFKAADGSAHRGSVWSQRNTDPVGCRMAPERNSGYVAWKLKLCSSSVHNGPTTRITALDTRLQRLNQRPGRSEQKRTQQDSHTGRWRAQIQNIKGLLCGSRSSATTTG